MPRIVAVEPVPRRPKERRVTFDDGVSVDFLPETASANCFTEGDTFSDSQLAAIIAGDGLERCRTAAWRLLEAAQRTRKQMEDALRKRRHSPDAIREILDAVERMGYLDEKRFATDTVESKGVRGGHGPKDLEQRLRMAGVSSETRREALEDIRTTDTQTALARKTLDKWLKSHRKKPAPEGSGRREVIKAERAYANRAAEFLARRGFEAEIVWEVVRAALARIEED